MIGKIRLFVGALVVLLALAPAVVRATRVVEHSSRPTIALSFKKSFDEPPHVADIPGEMEVTGLVLVECDFAAPVVPIAGPISTRTIDALRGPPVAVRS